MGLAELVPEKIEDEKSQGQEKRGKEDHYLVKHFAGEVIYFAGDEKEPGTLS